MALAGILEIQLLAELGRLSTDMKRAERVVQDSTDKMGRNVAVLESAFGKLGSTLGSTLALGAAFDAVRRLTDDFTKLNAQLRIATHSQAEYAQGLADVRRISTEAQADILATTLLYTRLTNALSQHGATQKQVSNITESVSLGLKAYGATSTEAASAMLQLSQAFGANRLGGEEFRAVSEAMPNMMKILAQSMGVPLSALKQLSAEGKITSEVMMKAWDNPAVIEALRKQADMTRTITGEMTILRNNLKMLVGEFMGASGSTSGITSVFRGLSDSVLLLANHIQGLAVGAQIMIALFAGKWLLSKQMAIRASVALREATAMETAGEVARIAKLAEIKQLEIYMDREKVVAANAAAKAVLAQTAAVDAALAQQMRLAMVVHDVNIAHAEALVMERERTAALLRLSTAVGVVNAAEVEAIAVERALAIERAAATAASEARAAAEIGALAKVANFAKGLVGGPLGVIGLALWGAYELADHMGWIDKLSNKLGDFFNTQESLIRRLKLAAGGGVTGDAMGRAIERFAKEQADKVAAEEKAKALRGAGIDVRKVGTVGGIDAELARVQGRATPTGGLLAMTGLTALSDMTAAKRLQDTTRLLQLMREELVKMQTVQGGTAGAFSASGAWTKIIEANLTDSQKRTEEVKKIKAQYMVELNAATSINATPAALKKLAADRDAAIKEALAVKRAGATPENRFLTISTQLASQVEAGKTQLTELQKVDELHARILASKLKITKAEEASYLLSRGNARIVDDLAAAAHIAAKTTEVERSTEAIKRETQALTLSKSELAAYDAAQVQLEINKKMVAAATALENGNMATYLALAKDISALQDKERAKKALGLTQEQKQMQAFITPVADIAFKGLAKDMGANWRDMTAAMQQQYQDKVIALMVENATKMLAVELAGFETYFAELGLSVNVIAAAIMLLVTTLLNQFAAMGAAGREVGKSTTLTASLGGATSGANNVLMQTDQSWFQGQKNWENQQQMSTQQLNAWTNSIRTTRHDLIVAGDALGYAGAASKELAGTIHTQFDPAVALARAIGSQLTPALILFQREGESLTQTAQRMTDTFTSTNALLAATGVEQTKAFGAMGLAGADARQGLIDASGGLSAFTANSQAFINNFLTPAEKLAPVADTVARTFEKLGVTGVTTNLQFAELVKQQLALGNTGVVSELLKVSGSFDQLTKSALDANTQLNALLGKQAFSSLVDYTRAQMTAGSAGTALALARAGLPTKLAGEAAGTAAFTAANAGGIAQASRDLMPITKGAVTTSGNGTAIDALAKAILGSLLGFGPMFGVIFGDTIRNWLDKLPDWLKGFCDTVSSWLSTLPDFLGGFVTSIGKWLGIKPEWVAAFTGQLFGWLGIKPEWLTKFADVLTAWATPNLDWIGTFAGKIVDWLGKAPDWLGTFADKLGGWFGKIDWVGLFAGALVGWIPGGLDWIGKFVEQLVSWIPGGLDWIGKFVEQLVSWIPGGLDWIGKFAEQLVSWIPGGVDWIGNFIGEIGKWLGDSVRWLDPIWQEFGGLGSRMLNAVVEAIKSSVSVPSLSSGVGGLTSGVLGGTMALGTNIVTGGLNALGIKSPFANGGAFTNGLFDSPTSFAFANGNGFSNGVMGEAGPEAVMPLRRDSSGRLGVSAQGNGGLAVLLNELISEVRQLRGESSAEKQAIATHTAKSTRILDKWDGQGMPPVRT